MPADTLRCPVCSGEDLSIETEYTTFESSLCFRNSGPKKIFGPNILYVRPDKGRVCLECGYVMLFVKGKELEKLKNAPKVRP